jgi:citrate lyase subunit beta/citryl-CoA lyase
MMYVVPLNERHVASAYASEVDAVVLELEDAVALSRKDDARRAAAEILASKPEKPTYVRINPAGTGLTLKDVEAVASPHLEGVRLAKTETAADVYAVGWVLDELGSSAGIQVLLETARGIQNMEAAVAAHPRVMGVGIGEQDLRADLGVDGAGYDYMRSKVIIAARVAELPAPWQSVWVDLNDMDGLRETTIQGKRMGFFGRTAIHPTQIPVINEIFTPSPEEIARAEEMVAALDAAKREGVAGLRMSDGTFIDNAVVLAAQRTLAFRP